MIAKRAQHGHGVDSETGVLSHGVDPLSVRLAQCVHRGVRTGMSSDGDQRRERITERADGSRSVRLVQCGAVGRWCAAEVEGDSIVRRTALNRGGERAEEVEEHSLEEE